MAYRPPIGDSSVSTGMILAGSSNQISLPANPTLDQLEAAINTKIDEVTATLMWLSGIKEGTDLVLHADNGDWRCVFTENPTDTQEN